MSGNSARVATSSAAIRATTHHPETVRKFSDETTFVVARRSHLGPAVVCPLSDFAYTGDLVNALIRDEIIGTPEALKKEVKMSFEEIGDSLAGDCGPDSEGLWRHDQLRHNAAVQQRLVETIMPFLF